MTDKNNDTNEKKEDAATERAREIVNAMFEGKSTLANSATSKEELPEDAASKVAVVAGRAAGNLRWVLVRRRVRFQEMRLR